MTKIVHFKGTATFCAFVLLAGIIGLSPAQTSGQNASTSTDTSGESEMRPIIEYYAVDRGSFQRSCPISISAARWDRFRKFYADALERIKKLDFDRLSQEEKVDYILFRHHAVLAHASVRKDHLFTQFSSGEDVATGMH
jgi:hypothetical protein